VSTATSAVNIEDVALVEHARRGDAAAFTRLVRKYQDRVYNTCWRLCGHAEDARDLTQETFLRAFDALDRFERRAGFYTWLYRIAVNLAISHRRKAHRGGRLTFHDGDGARLIGQQAADLVRRTGAARTTDPAADSETRELRRAVQAALESLDEDHRVILVLRDIEGLDYREIGDVLELPLGTIKSRVHRARMALRERLAPMLGEA
jgi:RNA polymerase sigma-70 factor (ECF subfamily)